jgi:hypothetical protein
MGSVEPLERRGRGTLRGPAARDHLSEEAGGVWGRVWRVLQLDERHARVLQVGLEARDTGRRVRELLAADGLTVRDRYGPVTGHPVAAIQREPRWMRAVRQFGLSEGLARRPPRVAR